MNIGHQHPKVVAAIREQAERLCTIAPFHANDQRSEAARLIAELAPGDLDMVFFTNGGAEATENATRMARLVTGRQKVLTTYRSLPRRHRRLHHHDRRPPAVAERAGLPGRRPLLRALPVPVGVPRHHRGRGGASGRCSTSRTSSCSRARHRGRHHAGDGGRHQRHPRAARRLPRRRARPVRPLRHRDDLRRGHGRLRPLRRVVRRRPLGRHARPHLLRQGRQLRLRAPRRRDHQPAASPTPSPSAPTPAASPTPATSSAAPPPSPPSTP